MILKLIIVGILTLVFSIDNGSTDPDAFIDPSQYPEAERNESIWDTYANFFRFQDPYRWLENLEDQNTKKFIQDETILTEDYLQKSKYRDEIKDRYAELFQMEKFDGPFRKGSKYFSYRGIIADEQDILYVHDEPIADGREFFNPNQLDVFVTWEKTASAFSEDGKVYAYLTRENGFGSCTIQFKHLEREYIYTEKLTNVYYSKIIWRNSDAIFYLSHRKLKEEPSTSTSSENEYPKLYYHELGTEQDSDIWIMDLRFHQDYQISFQLSDDDIYLIASGSYENKNIVGITQLAILSHDLIPIVSEWKAKYEFVTNIGTQFIFRTNHHANNYKLASIDVAQLDSWRDLVPQDNNRVLSWAKVASNKYMVLGYIAENMGTVLQLHEVATGVQVLTFQLDIGTVVEESFYSDKKSNDVYFKFESFLTPGIIYYYDLSNLSSPKPQQIKEIVVPNFDPSQYTVEYVTYPSKDMVEIPMYIVRKQEINFDGNNFTFMNAEGEFGVCLVPYFSIYRAVILQNFGGIHALPNIRGGGEKGEAWHIAGTKANKQNSMNDFQAAAEYLIGKKYTAAKLLAIYGGAAGASGPLIGASLNQRPDLFGVAIAEDSLTDMLRYDRFEIGHDWESEYGSSKFEADFHYLRVYSPLHNVQIDTTEYPATMLVVATDDSRVPALHSLKFIATLQNEARRTSIQLEGVADITSFIAMNTGIEFNS